MYSNKVIYVLYRMYSLEKQATEHDSIVTEVHFKATL